MRPSYSVTEFKTACKRGRTKVRIKSGARETAKTDFRLNKVKDILNFIGYGGLEKMEFINTKPWKNNSEPTIPIMVDSYGFYSWHLYGYIAFMFNENTEEWAIKSFKKNNTQDIRNQPFKGLKVLTC
jgi:hypothetical protein